MKDVVMLAGYQELEVDFVADNPGLTLFSLPSTASHGLRFHDAVRLHVGVQCKASDGFASKPHGKSSRE